MLVQNLFDQVIHDIAVAAGKGFDKVRSFLKTLHGQCRHLQTGDPAFGTGIEGSDILGREIETHCLIE